MGVTDLPKSPLGHASANVFRHDEFLSGAMIPENLEHLRAECDMRLEGMVAWGMPRILACRESSRLGRDRRSAIFAGHLLPKAPTHV
jgi:hypothetical protein